MTVSIDCVVCGGRSFTREFDEKEKCQTRKCTKCGWVTWIKFGEKELVEGAEHARLDSF